MPLTTEEAIRRYALFVPSTRADPAGAQASASSVGLAGQAGGRRPSRWARPALISWRSSGGSAGADHDARHQPQRGVAARLARPRHSGSPRDPAAAGRADRGRRASTRATSRQPPRRGRLLAADLSWYRITSRDAGTGSGSTPRRNRPNASPVRAPPSGALDEPDAAENDFNRLPGVADWRDAAKLPRLSRDLLEEASGITIPSSNFVLRVILAYLIAVVPLNWLICRFVLNRREWAWVVVPLVALGFAIGVERVAARDMGYDTASDEIDLLEVHGDYPRAHLTRMVSLYTTGRSQFAISYPNDPTALALPLDNGRSIRGEEVSTLDLAIVSRPGTGGFLGSAAQPVDVPGGGDGGLERARSASRGRRAAAGVVNGSELELRDAVLIDLAGPNERRERYLGTIAPGASVAIDRAARRRSRRRGRVGPRPRRRTRS